MYAYVHDVILVISSIPSYFLFLNDFDENFLPTVLHSVAPSVVSEQFPLFKLQYRQVPFLYGFPDDLRYDFSCPDFIRGVPTVSSITFTINK